MMGVIWWIVVGLVAGWLTGKVEGSPGKGALMDVIVGLLGALVGGLVMGVFGFRPEGGFVYTVVVAVIGAVLLTWAFRKVTAATA